MKWGKVQKVLGKKAKTHVVFWSLLFSQFVLGESVSQAIASKHAVDYYMLIMTMLLMREKEYKDSRMIRIKQLLR